MILLRPMSWTECRTRWEWLRQGLERCREHGGERWYAEDIYEPLRLGHASAFAVERNRKDVGFAILQRHNDPDGAVLFVWALWVEPAQAVGDKGALLAEFERIAIEVKAVRIRMESPRKGWDSIGFFIPMRTIYEHEVSRETKPTYAEARNPYAVELTWNTGTSD